MTLFVISFLIGCLSVMTVRGKRGNWPPGMPVTRPEVGTVPIRPGDRVVIVTHSVIQAL
ncbi:hypothetical protein EDD27_0842 [Nonomuraea polychroma]|uniref:Uncharacterized protein n=1 Tax=Nonomuraea polychroma TaxID=46176 RepID=A0A438LYB5_9ACTN|nr:hypothetical protein [Nonomuraea polychroma]RVX38529.1 hypothetical protein EDD27_0842 [Nonomuraea polychroma]